MPAQDTYGVFYDHAQWTGKYSDDQRTKKIYEDVVMVEVMIKGNKNSSMSYRKTPEHEEMYPKAWANYNREAGVGLEGTPLRNMSGMGAGQIMNLQATGIDTVEDLAELNDNVVIGEPGMLDLRKKARAYIAALYPEKAEAARLAAQTEKEAQEEEIESLKMQMAEMKKLLENTAAIPHKRTRRKRNPETGKLE